MKYRIMPLGDFTNDEPRLARLCELLAEKQISQNVAQAAAWHVANGITWEQLAAKKLPRGKYFTDEELQAAAFLTSTLHQLAQSTGSSTP